MKKAASLPKEDHGKQQHIANLAQNALNSSGYYLYGLYSLLTGLVIGLVLGGGQ